MGGDSIEKVGGSRDTKVDQVDTLEAQVQYLQVETNRFSWVHGDQLDFTDGERILGGGRVVIESTGSIALRCGASYLKLTPEGVEIQGPIVRINTPTGPPAASSGPVSAPARLPAAPEEPPTLAGARAEGNAAVAQGPTPSSARTGWLELELVDEADRPVPSEPFRVTDAEGRVVEGALDARGFARVDGIAPGDAEITFPGLDTRAWERLS
jgi:type VI secretion system secreted protein VgrG